MRALRIHAGPAARRHLRERGLRPSDVGVIPGAAGGPKGLALNALDRYLFGDWLGSGGASGRVHLVGASVGAWRLATACLDRPAAALAAMADDYVAQTYEHAPGRRPTPRQASDVFVHALERQFAGRLGEVLAHPRFRLHVFASRGRHLLRSAGRWRTPLGYLGAFAANALHRRAMGAWIERVVFSDPRDALPVSLADFRSRVVALTEANFAPALIASCSIPFWLEAVRDIPGAPRGAYWDGGITDYHLRLDYASLAAHDADPGAPCGPLVLYPHFQRAIVPGWLDKPFRRRHAPGAGLDNVVLLAPDPDWVKAALPNGKLPDRGDFAAYEHDVPGRQAAWRRAVAEGGRLADEFAARVAGGRPFDAEPL